MEEEGLALQGSEYYRLNMDGGVRLRVGGSYPGDTSFGRCRLHPETMRTLELSSGDVVAISTDQWTIGAYVSPAPTDERGVEEAENDVIYVNVHMLVGERREDILGQSVMVRSASPSPARRLVHESLPPGTASAIRSILAPTNLVGTLAMVGTRMAADSTKGTATQSVFPQVYETDPDGIVVVTEETTIERRPDTDI